ncbi:3741_t:CDS:2, partial [Acaulospora colombiana]
MAMGKRKEPEPLRALVTKKKRGSISVNKTGRGGGSGAIRGGGTRGRGSRGIGGRKPSIPRQHPSGVKFQEIPEGAGLYSAASTPASSTAPSTPRESFVSSVPQTPGEEIDQYILREEEITDQDLTRTNKDSGIRTEAFSPEQTERFEVYRRSALSKPNIKKALSDSVIPERVNTLLKLGTHATLDDRVRKVAGESMVIARVYIENFFRV